MYNIIHFISFFVRQFILPNPYINWFEDAIVADMFNIIVGGTMLGILSYMLTGLFYVKGIDNPIKGSVCYCLIYCVLTGVITLTGHFIKNIKIAIIVFGIIYILMFVIFKYIFRGKHSLI